mgnify:CR=1 FL=1
MGKVLKLSDLHKKEPKQTTTDNTSLLWRCKAKLLDAAFLLDELESLAMTSLHDYGFDEKQFHLTERSVQDYLASDLEEFYSGGEESLDLGYQGFVDSVMYRILVSAQMEGEDMYLEPMLLRWNGTEWLHSDWQGGWFQGAGADFFGDENGE